MFYSLRRTSMTSKNGTSFWNLRSLQGVCEKNRVPLIKLYFNKDQQDDAQNENYLHDNNFEYISEKHLKTSAAEFTYATAVALIGPFENLSPKSQSNLMRSKPSCVFSNWSFWPPRCIEINRLALPTYNKKFVQCKEI